MTNLNEITYVDWQLRLNTIGSVAEGIDDTADGWSDEELTSYIKEHNITYQYTCQDAFSYQYTRQQSGYTIENDSTSENFIGPKTIDWWVIQKIIPECYIQYQYVPLSLGLYAEKTNNSYKVNTFTKETREK